MIKREDDGIWVVLRETIACHHDEVFACLTTAGGLSRWFPVAAKVDLKVGGEIVLGWKGDFSRKTTISIIDYDAEGLIVWDWSARASDKSFPVHWLVEPNVEEGRATFQRSQFHTAAKVRGKDRKIAATDKPGSIVRRRQAWCQARC